MLSWFYSYLVVTWLSIVVSDMYRGKARVCQEGGKIASFIERSGRGEGSE
jgi:hypothetical protein